MINIPNWLSCCPPTPTPALYDRGLTNTEQICKIEWFLKHLAEYVNTLGNVQDIDASNIYFIDKINDLREFSLTVNCGLLVINNGENNVVPTGTIFQDGIDILFICGTLSGDFTINGNILAGKQRLFGDGSSIKINTDKNPIGFPEYFGATPNNVEYDNSDAINKCITTFPCTQLASCDYYIEKPIEISISHRTIKGVQINQEYLPGNDGLGTRLIQISPTSHGIVIGDGTKNAENCTTVHVEQMSILNYQPVWNNKTYGVYINGARAVYIDHITCNNFRDGFHFGYVIQSYITYSRHLSQKPNSDTSVSCGFGFDDLPASSLGIASTVSLYINYCDVHFNNHSASNYGVRFYNDQNPIADVWVQNCNFYGCASCILFASNYTGSDTMQDIIISNNCCDNCTDGIHIIGRIVCNIYGNWVSVGAWNSITKHGIYLDNCDNGSIMCGNTIKSGNSVTDESDYGIRVTGGYNIVCTGNLIYNYAHPIFCNDVVGLELVGNAITNTKQNFDSIPAIMVETVRGCSIDCALSSRSPYTYQFGVRVTSDCYGVNINPNCLVNTAISQNRVIISGIAQTNDNVYKVLTNGNTISGAITW